MYLKQIIKQVRKILAEMQALVACWCWQRLEFIQSKLSQPSVKAFSWQLSLARVREDLSLLAQQHATAWCHVLRLCNDLNMCPFLLTLDFINHLTELHWARGCAFHDAETRPAWVLPKKENLLDYNLGHL